MNTDFQSKIKVRKFTTIYRDSSTNPESINSREKWNALNHSEISLDIFYTT